MQAYRENYPHLFSKWNVGKQTLRNRIVAAPTHHGFAAAPDGRINRCGVETYGERALGGAAVVTIGEGKLDDRNSAGHTGQIDCCTEGAITPLRWYAEYVHTCGGLASIELNHAGQFAQPQFNPGGIGPMGASACVMPNGLYSREMTEEDMEEVAEHYAQACGIAKAAGLDMVTLHLGHGWLLGGFLSPMFNHRRDRYGGSPENRVRFPRMVLERVRQAVGPDFLIEIRLSGEEWTPDGLKIGDTIEIVRLLEDFADMVQISSGTRLDPVARCMIGPDHFVPPGHNAPLSEALKRAGTKLPVGVVGSISTPQLAEEILARGQADYVVLARSLIADPMWPQKSREGREADIRPCIKCSRCGDMHKSVCSVNPLFGTASIRKAFPSPRRRKRVAVVGGGVAGMQAAITAAERGHTCVLYEREDRLGGQLFHTEYVWFKREMRAFRDYLIRQVAQAGVEVHLRAEATPAQLTAAGFDSVIVAVGAQAFRPPIPGADRRNAVTAPEVFGREAELPGEVLIVGGGMVGCELALHLSAHGIRSTVIEMGPKLAPDAVPQEREHTLYRMEQDGNISVYTELRCTEITAEGIVAQDPGGGSRAMKAELVIFAAGMRARERLRDSFDGCAPEVVAVGDCKAAGNIHDAVSTGYSAALLL